MYNLTRKCPPGAAHFVSMNSETAIDTPNFSDKEIEWVESDLAAVNRSRTPWVVAHFHRPMYCSNDGDCDKQVEQCVTNLSQLNPNMSQLNLNLTQLNPNPLQLNPNLSQLNPNPIIFLWSLGDSSHHCHYCDFYLCFPYFSISPARVASSYCRSKGGIVKL